MMDGAPLVGQRGAPSPTEELPPRPGVPPGEQEIRPGVDGAADQPQAKGPAEAPPGRVPRGPLVIAAVIVGTLIGWGTWGQYERAAEASRTEQQTEAFIPTVQVARAKREDGPVMFSLPGTINAFDQATIYARSTGYIAERRVDIGTRVKKGDLLVLVSAPDLDQQLAQANAQLAQTQAAVLQATAQAESAASSANLANVTNQRTSSLAVLGWETKQNADNARLGLAGLRSGENAAQAAVKVAQANLGAQSAVVNRLEQLKQYENVTAPFDGVITSRSVDIGDLVSADSNGAGNPLFTLARDSVVRVQVDVPQSGAIGIHDGLDATARVAELPGRAFKGKVTRSAVALVQSSRTMRMEVDIENADGALRPGLYVSLDIAIPRPAPGIVIPAESIIFNGQGLRVAVVGGGGAVHLQNVAIYRDFGTSVELRSGLDGGELVVLSLPSTVGEGGKVKFADTGQ